MERTSAQNTGEAVMKDTAFELDASKNIQRLFCQIESQPIIIVCFCEMHLRLVRWYHFQFTEEIMFKETVVI